MIIHLERASDLLARTDLSIPAVAKASGFTSAVVFAAFFRRTLGLTPTAYRRTHRLP